MLQNQTTQSKIYLYMGRCLRQMIQHHSNPSLCLNNWHWRSWTVLWRSITPSRINTELEYKRRKSRYTWENRHIWPQGTKWSKAVNILVIVNTLFQQCKWWLHTWTSLHSQRQNQTHYVLCNSRWRNSIQSGKTRPGADYGSDHELLIASVIKWKSFSPDWLFKTPWTI